MSSAFWPLNSIEPVGLIVKIARTSSPGTGLLQLWTMIIVSAPFSTTVEACPVLAAIEVMTQNFKSGWLVVCHIFVGGSANVFSKSRA